MGGVVGGAQFSGHFGASSSNGGLARGRYVQHGGAHVRSPRRRRFGNDPVTSCHAPFTIEPPLSVRPRVSYDAYG